MPDNGNSSDVFATFGTTTDDPNLKELADYFIGVLRLAVDKAVAHATDAASFPLPAGSSLEQLVVERFATVEAQHRQTAGAAAVQRLSRPPVQRQQDYGKAAGIDVHTAQPVTRLATPFLPVGALQALAAGHGNGSVGGSGHAPVGLTPQSSGDTLSLRVREVFCGDETDPELGHDEIWLQGVALDDRAVVTPIPAFRVGDFTENAGSDTVTYSPPRGFASFDLHNLIAEPLATSGWPKAYSVSLFLVEADGHGMGEWLAGFVNQFRGEIVEYLKDHLTALAGASIGAGIGSAFPGLGTLVGALVGYVIGAAVDKLIGWIRGWGEDDVFDPITARCGVGGMDTFFGGWPVSREQVQSISGHGGEYRLRWDWRIDWANQWAAFGPLGGTLTSAPAAAEWTSNHFDVFARAADQRLWGLTYDGGWKPWKQISPEVITTGPAAVSWSPGRIDVFAGRGPHNSCGHIAFDGGTWHAWQDMPSVMTAAPAACSWGAGRLDVFHRGQDNHCYHAWYDGSWHMWEHLGGIMGDAPAAVATAPGKLVVFCRDNSAHHLWMKRWDGSQWIDWVDLGGKLTSAPAASSVGDGTWSCVARAADGRLWSISGVDGDAGPWELVGGMPSEAPAAVSNWHVNRVDYFVVDETKQLRHRKIVW